MSIQELKSQLCMEELLSDYGLYPDKNNRLHCPFHEDKTPSMMYYPESGTVYCFSSNCQHGKKSIDTIDFRMLKENVSKHAAILQLKEKVSPNGVEDLEKVFGKMALSLSRSPKAKSYLTARGIIGLEVGYNPYKSDYKPLQNCVVFPLRNKSGKIVSLYGRSISNNPKSKHFYLKNTIGLYPCYPKSGTKTLVITECIIDAATLAKHTDYEILALYGTNRWKTEHDEAIKSVADLEEVILFMDGDEAGNLAAEKYAKRLQTLGKEMKISVVQTPEGEDINSLLQGHEPSILGHLIENRLFVFSNENKKSIESNGLQIMNENYINWAYGDLEIVVIGGVKLHPIDKLLVTLQFKRKESEAPLHRLRQRIDLNRDDAVEKLARKVGERLEISSLKVHESMLLLMDKLEEHRAEQLALQRLERAAPRQLTAEQRAKAVAFLSEGNLLERTNGLIGKTGVIGEEKNRLSVYLVYTSRLMKNPLHVICLGESGTGKTHLQEKISELMPASEKINATAMSDNSMYYFEGDDLKHKIVIIEDLDGVSEEKLMYALRELMSKKEISKVIVHKDDLTGKMRTIILKVEGPIVLTGTTTRERLYEDNANRCLLIYLDTSKAQSERIMAYQRKVSAGKISQKGEEKMREYFRDMQSILKPIKVVNPYAEDLIIPATVFKPLRTNAHYLQFIEAITFYHQYQREVKYNKDGEAFIETTIEDIEWANELMKEVLLAKSDELSKECRRFLERVKKWLKNEGAAHFYQQKVRATFRLPPSTMKYYLSELRRYGYLSVSGGSRYKGYEYSVTDEGEYGRLNDLISNALDTVLAKIKEQKSV